MIKASAELSLCVVTYSSWIIWEVQQYCEYDYFFPLEATRILPHCRYLQVLVILLYINFYIHHLLHLSPLHLFAPYLTTIFTKFHLPHQFFHVHPVRCEQAAHSLSSLHQYSSLYGMIEAKLPNELGFLCALNSHSYLLLWQETKKYMNKVL